MSFVLNRETAAALAVELADAGPEHRLKKAINRWQTTPTDTRAADVAAVWATERGQLPEDRRRALLALCKRATAERATGTPSHAPVAQVPAHEALLAVGRLHDRRPA